MNALHIAGNLTANPESRIVNGQNGANTVCNFTVATNRYARGKKVTEYFRITLWGNSAENAMKYLAKGRPVCVTGPVTARPYIGNDGKPHCTMEIQDVKELEYMGNRLDAEPQTGGQAAPGGYQDSGYTYARDEELPFNQ